MTAPTIFKNLIFTGAGTGEGPGGSKAGAGPAGDTRAWDARSGKLVWTFQAVPRPGEFGYDTWGADSARNRSGVNVWGYMSLDAEIPAVAANCSYRGRCRTYGSVAVIDAAARHQRD